MQVDSTRCSTIDNDASAKVFVPISASSAGGAAAAGTCAAVAATHVCCVAPAAGGMAGMAGMGGMAADAGAAGAATATSAGATVLLASTVVLAVVSSLMLIWDLLDLAFGPSFARLLPTVYVVSTHLKQLEALGLLPPCSEEAEDADGESVGWHPEWAFTKAAGHGALTRL